MIAPTTNSGASGGRFPGTRALKIIVADDERDTVLSLMAILRFEGHEVRGFHTGREVVEAARRDRPHAVILDIAMPEMSGYAVARELREILGRDILLIACSGEFKSKTDQLLGEAVGFDHYLMKPCDPDRIIRLLEPLRNDARRP